MSGIVDFIKKGRITPEFITDKLERIAKFFPKRVSREFIEEKLGRIENLHLITEALAEINADPSIAERCKTAVNQIQEKAGTAKDPTKAFLEASMANPEVDISKLNAAGITKDGMRKRENLTSLQEAFAFWIADGNAGDGLNDDDNGLPVKNIKELKNATEHLLRIDYLQKLVLYSLPLVTRLSYMHNEISKIASEGP